jgi:hypothetical protein
MIASLPDCHQRRALRLHELLIHRIHRKFRQVHIHEYLLADYPPWRQVREPEDGFEWTAAVCMGL